MFLQKGERMNVFIKDMGFSNEDELAYSTFVYYENNDITMYFTLTRAKESPESPAVNFFERNGELWCFLPEKKRGEYIRWAWDRRRNIISSDVI
jgi:hypothetical protein